MKINELLKSILVNIALVIFILILLILLWKLYCFVDFFSNEDLMELIVSTASIYIACLAYHYTKKSHKENVLNNIFITQISLLKHYFFTGATQKTELKNQGETIELITDFSSFFRSHKDDSIYKNFCNYFLENKEKIRFSDLTHRQIVNIWDFFCSKLANRSEFDYSFKFIYMCIHNIKESNLKYDEKKRYIKIISDMINSEQMFCYFINLIHMCNGDCTKDDTVKLLRDYRFFGDMFNSKIFNEVKDIIPIDIVKCFSV